MSPKIETGQNLARSPAELGCRREYLDDVPRLPPAETEAVAHGKVIINNSHRAARSASVISTPFGPKPTNRPEEITSIGALLKAVH